MTVSPTQPAPFDVQGAVTAAIMAQGGGATSQKDQALVPLWRVNPRNKSGVDIGTKVGFGPTSGFDAAMSVGADIGTSATSEPQTQAYAESYWLDMSLDDRKAFATQAKDAGLWDPQSGAEGLGNAWSKSVDSAAAYNASRGGDKSKWISPFEAVDKLAIQGIADENGGFDPFTNTNTDVKQFNANELYSNAKSILQSNLGRDPSDAELSAYTIAVNEAARNAAQVTTQSGVRGPNGTDQQTLTQGGSFDPNQVIDQMSKDNPEYAGVQAGTKYLPALLQAMGATV